SLVHQHNPEHSKRDVDQRQNEIEQRAQSMRQDRDKHPEDDGDGEPRDRETDRLTRVKADVLVLIVRLEVKKNQAGDEAQQVCQRRNNVGLRSSAVTVHREFSFSSRQPLICSRTYQGIAMRSRAARTGAEASREAAYSERVLCASRRSIAAVA